MKCDYCKVKIENYSFDVVANQNGILFIICSKCYWNHFGKLCENNNGYALVLAEIESVMIEKNRKIDEYFIKKSGKK